MSKSFRISYAKYGVLSKFQSCNSCIYVVLEASKHVQTFQSMFECQQLIGRNELLFSLIQIVYNNSSILDKVL